MEALMREKEKLSLALQESTAKEAGLSTNL